MRLDQRMDRITAAAGQESVGIIKTMIGTQPMTSQQSRIASDYEQRCMALVLQAAGWKAIEPEMVGLYTSTYTEAEIDGILSFYKSPIGQAFVAKTPDVDKKKSQLMKRKLSGLEPQAYRADTAIRPAVCNCGRPS